MKRLTIGGFLILVLGLGMPASSFGEGSSIGWQCSSLINGISVKTEVSPNLCLQGIVGYTSLTIDDPTIKVDGEEEEINMGVSASIMTLGGRGLFKVKEETNMDVYVGGGLNYLKLSGKIDIGDKYEAIGGAIEFNGVGGVEYRFQGLPNLAFSTEIGFSYIKLNDIDLEYREEGGGDVEKATLVPNTSIKNFFLGAGIHYRF
jgi:hypothetical protein